MKCFKYANITHVYLHCHAVGVHASCPIELSPPSVVVRYGDPVSVNCSTSEIQHGGMGWEATQGGRSLEYNVQHLTWTVENLTDWPISPSCFLNMPNEQCSRKPKVVLYSKSRFTQHKDGPLLWPCLVTSTSSTSVPGEHQHRLQQRPRRCDERRPRVQHHVSRPQRRTCATSHRHVVQRRFTDQ